MRDEKIVGKWGLTALGLLGNDHQTFLPPRACCIGMIGSTTRIGFRECLLGYERWGYPCRGIRVGKGYVFVERSEV